MRNSWVGQEHGARENPRLARISPYLFGQHGLRNILYLPKLRDLPCCGLDTKAIVFDFGFNPGTQPLPPTGAAKILIGIERPILIWGITAAANLISAAGVAAWAAGTTYAAGALVSYFTGFPLPWNRIYISLQAGNTGHNPSNSPTWWQLVTSPYDVQQSGYQLQLLHSQNGNQRQFFSKAMTPSETAGVAGLPFILKLPYAVLKGDELTCQVRNTQILPSTIAVQVVLYGGEFD
jgi:hypothetical protein